LCIISLHISNLSILSLADKTFNRPADIFYKIPLLDDAEFGLLLAILCSHSGLKTTRA
jgi:hypothetical protein